MPGVVSNVLLLSQTTGYLVTLMLSLCVVGPTSLHMSCFKGRCLLFTTGTFLDDGNFSAVWASRGYCIYILFVGTFLLVVSAIQSTRMLVLLYKGSDSSFLSAFLESLLTLIMTVCVFIACILVTIGFKTWCEAVTQRFRSCDEASVMEIDTADKIKIEGFYVQIGTAQFGVWGCWVCSVLLVVLSVLKLCRYHEREIMRVSMARQRRDIMRHQYEQPVESADDA